MTVKKEQIYVKNMVCSSCEEIIAETLKGLAGVVQVEASFKNGAVYVHYDTEILSLQKIENTIQRIGYEIGKRENSFFSMLVFVLLALLLLGNMDSLFNVNFSLDQNVTYFLLFSLGLLSSLHCLGMCGGILISQSYAEGRGKLGALLPSLSYNMGRIISYTFIGGMAGALGSAFTPSLSFKAGLMVLAGIFMVLMGVNLAGFNLFQKFMQLPWFKLSRRTKTSTPFVVGLLNGLMPCGPLQTVQLYALSTGSVLEGAMAMFFYAVGTVPLMLGLGTLNGLISRSATSKLLKFSGVLVLLLGLIMANRGLALAGIKTPDLPFLTLGSAKATGAVKAEIADGIQTVTIAANNKGYVPGAIVVQKGIPVKWVIEGEQINSCNNEIIVPSYKIQQKLKTGENVLEFLPETEGDINYSCWMGMLRGVIKVVADLEQVDLSQVQAPPSSNCSSCASGMGGGGGAASPIPLDWLVKKAELTGNTQAITISNFGEILRPMYTVVNVGIKTTLNFDFRASFKAEGQYEIVNLDTEQLILKFNVQGNSAQVNFVPEEVGVYGIVKDGAVLGALEVVPDLKAVDVNELKDKLIQ